MGSPRVVLPGQASESGETRFSGHRYIAKSKAHCRRSRTPRPRRPPPGAQAELTPPIAHFHHVRCPVLAAGSLAKMSINVPVNHDAVRGACSFPPALEIRRTHTQLGTAAG